MGFRENLPVLKGDYGTAWEEWPAGVAHILAMMRSNVNRYLSVETLCAFAISKDLQIREKIEEDLRISLLRMEQIAEHPWNGSADWEKVESNRRRIGWNKDLKYHTDCIQACAAKALFGASQFKADGYFAVINPLSWDTNRVLEIEINENVEVFDAKTLKKVSSIYCPECKSLIFIAKDIPAMGYRIFRLEKGKSGSKCWGRIDNAACIENGFYRVEIDMSNGSIKSLFDKKNNVELVNKKYKYGLNQYVYLSEESEFTFDNVKTVLDDDKIYKVKVKTGWNRNIETLYTSRDSSEFKNSRSSYASNQVVTLTENTEYTLRNISTRVEDGSPVCKTLVVTGETCRTKVESRITLYDGLDRVVFFASIFYRKLQIIFP